MVGESVRGVKGWLVVYILGSIPVLLFYAAGLSGWFFDYPIVLFVAIFFVLSIPLLLLLLKHPRAPRWNVAMVWVGAILITLRIIYGALFQGSGERLLAAMPTLLGIILFSLVWAIIWTRCFEKQIKNGKVKKS